MRQKLFTKSAFKIAMGCPARLYYYYDQEHYANQDSMNEFLKSLAEGGFQVGELAKIYHGVKPEHDLKDLSGYEEPVRRTAELMQLDKVTIAEGAFRCGNLFVRADIIRKDGNRVDLIEVKSKSWNPEKEDFLIVPQAGPYAHQERINGNALQYVYDVAFQKYVLTQAFAAEGRPWKVHAYLMLADKSVSSDTDGINQYFRIKNVNGRTTAVVEPGAEVLASHRHVLTDFDVDAECDKIIAGETAEQTATLHGRKFRKFVDEMSELYCQHQRIPVKVSIECYRCPFYSSSDTPGKLDGYDECWKAMENFSEADLREHLLEELWNNKARAFENGVRFLKDLSRPKLRTDPMREPPHNNPGLNREDRQIVQVALTTNQPHLLEGLASKVHNGIYMDKQGLLAEMSAWKFPLHMIDFETTMVALPFYENMRPYEQVAFQFSHHIIDSKDGGKTYTVRHEGQYINTKKGFFPNFEFIRALKRDLEKDDGTIFRYSNHENSVLNQILDQLQESNEPDKDELIAFIKTITQRKNSHAGHGQPQYLWRGGRNMVDLCEMVRRYYYDPRMVGSNSIKTVLPAVLNASTLLKEKYGRPIYGGTGEIQSLNIVASEPPKVWIKEKEDGSGEIENPYKWLPDVSEYLPEGCLDPEGEEEEDLVKVNNGGAALTAYSKIQFADLNETQALRDALLRYCELDTLAMVFIWEYFNDYIRK